MVDRINLNKMQLKKLYRKMKKDTNNFKEISAKVIAENSQNIIVLRLALGLSVKKFADICKRSSGSIDNLQRYPKKINFGVAEYYFNIIKRLRRFADYHWDSIISKYNKFYGRAINGVKNLPREERINFARMGASKSLEKRKKDISLYFKASKKGVEKQGLTRQEQKIRMLLKEKTIKHKVHEFIFEENIDFVVNDNILVGCASGKQKNLTHHARRLMYQAYRVKYYNKNLKYIAVLSNDAGNLRKEDVPIGAKKLLNEICNAWFVDEDIKQIIIFIAGSNLQAQQANDQ